MAFFYPSLNSWVLFSPDSGLHAQKSSINADTCAKSLGHVEFPLTFQTEFLQNQSAVKLPIDT
jgi:hypothetical protein